MLSILQFVYRNEKTVEGNEKEMEKVMCLKFM